MAAARRLIGVRLIRIFDGHPFVGTVTAIQNGTPLWYHVRYTDLDEEDLDAVEVARAIAAHVPAARQRMLPFKMPTSCSTMHKLWNETE